MEDSFRVRVDKAFGSLASSSSNASSSLSYLWCLTDEEIERREWNRERDNPDLEPEPYPSNLDGFFANQQKVPSQKKAMDLRKELETDLHDLNDDYEDDDSNNDDGKQRGGMSLQQLVKPDDHNDEEWDIRSSIGLDCTLDYEEEEDGYDKVAIVREMASDRLYMSDISDYVTDMNSYNELPDTLKDATRDPRANHMAAKIRLKEDAEAAGNFDSLRVSDNPVRPIVDTQNNLSGDDVNLKSILKRKESCMDPESQKRVRFDPGYKNDSEEESKGAKDLAMEICSMEEASVLEKASILPQDSSGVPDYIRNPSKYTHYTFDSSSDIDEESNCKAYMDFLTLMKRSNTMESQPDGTSIELPKSVTFTPKKKPGDALTVKNGNELKQNQEDVCEDSMHKKYWCIGIVSGIVEESEVCAMEEDEPETVSNKISSLQRPGRQYRTKTNIALDEHVT
uniref:U5 small nuclear ribonucleoprotein TSSC4 n=1 Tax=Davidia involucrata TaxID=16924 RepID=A0A5B7BGL2_DAVIN